MGTAVNKWVNSARDWGLPTNPNTDKPQGLVKRLVAPRAAMVGVTVCDIAQVAKNIVYGTLQVPGVAAKWTVKPFSVISGSTAVKKFENRFPGISNLLRTVAKIVSYTLGAAVAGTIGLIHPRSAIRFHDTMKLSYDKRATEILAETKIAAPCCEPKAELPVVIEEELVVVEAEVASKAAEIVEEAAAQVEEAAEELVASLRASEEEVPAQAETAAEEFIATLSVSEEEVPTQIETAAEELVASRSASEEEVAKASEEETSFSFTSSEENDAAETTPPSTWGNSFTNLCNTVTSSRLFKLGTFGQN